ncbi:MAG: hypothetical protein LUQ65_02410, partial [Candidatus Helarchaeota archaeon]|nr:hypothetical protein [Candidatus Helarchaeota archaeon]
FWEYWCSEHGVEPETDYYKKFMMDMGDIKDEHFFDGLICINIGRHYAAQAGRGRSAAQPGKIKKGLGRNSLGGSQHRGDERSLSELFHYGFNSCFTNWTIRYF